MVFLPWNRDGVTIGWVLVAGRGQSLRLARDPRNLAAGRVYSLEASSVTAASRSGQLGMMLWQVDAGRGRRVGAGRSVRTATAGGGDAAGTKATPRRAARRNRAPPPLIARGRH